MSIVTVVAAVEVQTVELEAVRILHDYKAHVEESPITTKLGIVLARNVVPEKDESHYS